MTAAQKTTAERLYDNARAMLPALRERVQETAALGQAA